MKFCVVSIEAKVSLRGFLTAYGKSIMLTVAPFYVRLRTTSPLSEHSVVIVVAPLVSLHCCVAHTWACWFQFLCREPERDRAVVRSLLAHIFPLHSELTHAHNYPCNRYQALFFARPSARSLRTRKIRPGDEANVSKECPTTRNGVWAMNYLSHE